MKHDWRGGIQPKAPRRVSPLGGVVVLGTLLILGLGCGVQNSRLSQGYAVPGQFRWAAADTSRLLRTARYFKLLGQPELGIKELEEAHRLDPGNLKVADALAQYYEESGLPERAQQVYLEALALAPDNPALQNNLCFSYYQAGNLTQAEKCYRETLARQPDNQAARNNLGLVLCRQGRQAEARQLWQEAEGEAAAARKLAEALAALGMAGEPRYARQTRPQPEAQPPGGQTSPGEAPVTASASPLPAPASPPAGNHPLETATRPAGPPPAAAAKLAATLAAKPSGADSDSPERRESKTVADPVAPAAPSPSQPAPALAAGNRPAGSLAPQSEAVPAPPPLSTRRATAAPAASEKASPPPVRPSQPGPQVAAANPAAGAPRVKSRAPLTVEELLETNITILNGNGIHDLARDLRSQLHLEGYGAVDINNFRDFGVGRTVIYYRPESERVAANLNRQFFPGAELKSAPQLADNIDVKVVLGHDLVPQRQAEAPQARAPRL